MYWRCAFVALEAISEWMLVQREWKYELQINASILVKETWLHITKPTKLISEVN